MNIGTAKRKNSQFLRGYETEDQAIDPKSLNFKKDVAEAIAQNELRSKGWQAKRFKRFPRFSIYLQRDKANTHLERNYISLNNRMLAYLAEPDPLPSRPDVSTELAISQDDINESDSAILMI